jgi:hypothetical protein
VTKITSQQIAYLEPQSGAIKILHVAFSVTENPYPPALMGFCSQTGVRAFKAT